MDGIYGRTYIRDEKGRVLEERYIGYDGQPKATKWGLGIKRFTYDENDNWIKTEYLTIDEKPAYVSDLQTTVFSCTDKTGRDCPQGL